MLLPERSETQWPEGEIPIEAFNDEIRPFVLRQRGLSEISMNYRDLDMSVIVEHVFRHGIRESELRLLVADYGDAIRIIVHKLSKEAKNKKLKMEWFLVNTELPSYLTVDESLTDERYTVLRELGDKTASQRLDLVWKYRFHSSELWSLRGHRAVQYKELEEGIIRRCIERQEGLEWFNTSIWPKIEHLATDAVRDELGIYTCPMPRCPRDLARLKPEKIVAKILDNKFTANQVYNALLDSGWTFDDVLGIIRTVDKKMNDDDMGSDWFYDPRSLEARYATKRLNEALEPSYDIFKFRITRQDIENAFDDISIRQDIITKLRRHRRDFEVEDDELEFFQPGNLDISPLPPSRKGSPKKKKAPITRSEIEALSGDEAKKLLLQMMNDNELPQDDVPEIELLRGIKVVITGRTGEAHTVKHAEPTGWHYLPETLHPFLTADVMERLGTIPECPEDPKAVKEQQTTNAIGVLLHDAKMDRGLSTVNGTG
jgi:hypothetical protein